MPPRITAPAVAVVPPGWMRDTACRDADPELFFAPEYGGPHSEPGLIRAAREYDAKQWCAACPVRTLCLRHALTVPEQAGVWGGASEHERREMARRAVARANTKPIQSVSGP